MIKSLFIVASGIVLVGMLGALPGVKHQEVGKDVEVRGQSARVSELPHVEYAVASKIPVSNREIGEQEAAKVGWTGEQWVCLEKLWTNESQWRESAFNNSSGATGVAQFLDSTWSMTDYQRTFDVRTQIKAGIQYIQRTRYKTPCAAYTFWLNPTSAPFDQHWY